MLRAIGALFRRWRERREVEKAALGPWPIRLVDDGFERQQPRKPETVQRVHWSDVRRIQTYKRDLFAYDMICLAFEIGDDKWVEIWERDDGFVGVAEAMRTRFPTIPEDWYNKVMVPAFETNLRDPYRRSGHASEGTTPK